jgi:hypothetical protein
MRPFPILLQLDISDERDGLVLTDDGLADPALVTREALRKMTHSSGREFGAPRRYARNYPVPDTTTPTYREFIASGGSRRGGYKR